MHFFPVGAVCSIPHLEQYFRLGAMARRNTNPTNKNLINQNTQLREGVEFNV
jgi:hypothetical protein